MTDFRPGEQLWIEGLDELGRETLLRCIFVRDLPRPTRTLNCVVRQEGDRLTTHSGNLHKAHPADRVQEELP